jgi:predicted HAD superfamily Cof-like phosphohydrolase
MKGYDVDGAWTEVARSNLAKIDINTGKVIKRADGKVLKPEGWTAPVLAPFVKA